MKKVVVLLMLLVISFAYAEVFIINSMSETVSKINLEDGSVDNVFCSTGSMPNKLDFWDEKMYVVNSGDNSLGIFSIEDGTCEGEIFIEDSANPYNLLIVENFAYVSGALTNKLYKIDLQAEAVENELVVGNNPSGIYEFNSKLYVGNTDYSNGYIGSSISVIDIATFTIDATIETSMNPQYITSFNEMIFVSCGGNWADVFGEINVINPETNSVVEEMTIGGNPSNFAYFLENFYLGDAMGTGIYAFNPMSYEVLYDASNPLIPGAQLVASNSENLFTLKGFWGSNFVLRVYDETLNEISQYEVGLGGTDLKIYEGSNSNEDEIVEAVCNCYNYPNPFNPTTTITYSIIEDSFVSIDVFNIKGRKVVKLVDEQLTSGEHSVVWNGKDENGDSVGSGVYFYKIKSKDTTITKRMVLLK